MNALNEQRIREIIKGGEVVDCCWPNTQLADRCIGRCVQQLTGYREHENLSER